MRRNGFRGDFLEGEQRRAWTLAALQRLSVFGRQRLDLALVLNPTLGWLHHREGRKQKLWLPFNKPYICQIMCAVSGLLDMTCIFVQRGIPSNE